VAVRVNEVGKGAGQLRQPPQPTYGGGKGISIFTNTVISEDYIKAMGRQGRMKSQLYAVAMKATRKLEFRPANGRDFAILDAARKELEIHRTQWERDGIIPTEDRYKGDCDRSYVYGITSGHQCSRLGSFSLWQSFWKNSAD